MHSQQEGLNGARVYIGMGSNLGDPLAQLCSALNTLESMESIKLISCSSVYRSEPLGGMDQPDYLNAALDVRTTLSPWALLRALQSIETHQGRERGQRWGSRTLDLDILLYDAKEHADHLLILPHPGIYMRRFVLAPLAEIAPGLQFPDGSSVEQRLRDCPASEIQLIEVNEFKLSQH